MKKIATLVFLFVLSFQIFGQGSGTTLSFDGVNDYVQLQSPSPNGMGSSTVEMWVKVPTVGAEGLNASERVGILLGNYNASPNVNYEIHDDGQCRIWWNNGEIDIYGTTDLRDNTWHHLAFVRDVDANKFYIYIDGMLENTHSGIGSDVTLTTLPRIGGDNRNDNGGPSFHGQMDEIRVWSDARSQAEIRDNMCKKLSGTEANLDNYYKFDDNSGTTLKDEVGGNDGTLTNMTNTWPLSGAPIGDASTHLYTTDFTGQNINLTSGNRGNFDVNTVTGNPDGVHVYRVDGVPNSTTGINPSLGSSNVYYGTFVVGGTSPSYAVEYDYTNYDDATDQEPELLLYNRGDNSVTNWGNVSATVNDAENTLNQSSVNTRGEFIISGKVNPLPIELLYFNVQSVNNNLVQLDWQTNSEINNDFFTVERSINRVDWEVIKIVDGAGNSNAILNYSIIDKHPYLGHSYYRLKNTDFDGQFKYSQIRNVNVKKLDNSEVEIYPNPATNQITVKGNFNELKGVVLYNTLGQNVTSLVGQIITNENQVIIDLSKLSKGIYYVKTKTTANKVYKQ